MDFNVCSSALQHCRKVLREIHIVYEYCGDQATFAFAFSADDCIETLPFLGCKS